MNRLLFWVISVGIYVVCGAVAYGLAKARYCEDYYPRAYYIPEYGSTPEWVGWLAFVLGPTGLIIQAIRQLFMTGRLELRYRMPPEFYEPKPERPSHGIWW